MRTIDACCRRGVPVLEVPDSFKKIVLVRDVVKPTYDENGILTMSVYDFLLNRKSLD